MISLEYNAYSIIFYRGRLRIQMCQALRQLDQNFNYMVRCALKNCVKNGYRPLKFDSLKLKNRALYGLLADQ